MKARSIQNLEKKPRRRPQRARQGDLFYGTEHEKRTEHGGDVREGRRKLPRPLDARLPLHVVMRSRRARGEWSFLHRRNRSRVQSILFDRAREWGVTIDELANVGNHLHLIVRFKSRDALQGFLKAIGGKIARTVTGAKKGNKKGRFWDATAYTRTLTWGRELKAVTAYLSKNRIEAIGFKGARLKIKDDGTCTVVLGGTANLTKEEFEALVAPEERRLFGRDPGSGFK